MNKQQKKTAIVDNLLNIANHSEKGYKHNFHDVTFYCPGISEYVDGANGVLVKFDIFIFSLYRINDTR